MSDEKAVYLGEIVGYDGSCCDMYTMYVSSQGALDDGYDYAIGAIYGQLPIVTHAPDDGFAHIGRKVRITVEVLPDGR